MVQFTHTEELLSRMTRTVFFFLLFIKRSYYINLELSFLHSMPGNGNSCDMTLYSPGHEARGGINYGGGGVYAEDCSSVRVSGQRRTTDVCRQSRSMLHSLHMTRHLLALRTGIWCYFIKVCFF